MTQLLVASTVLSCPPLGCIFPSNWKLSEFRPRPIQSLVENPCICIYVCMYVCINFYEGPLINIKFYCDHFINLRSKIPCWKMVEENFSSKDTIMNKRVYTCILIRRSPLGLQRNQFFVKLSWTFLTSSRSSGVPASGSCWALWSLVLFDSV